MNIRLRITFPIVTALAIFTFAALVGLTGSLPAHAANVPGLNDCVSSEIRGDSSTLHFINNCSVKAKIVFFLNESDRPLTEWADPGQDDNTLLSVPRGGSVSYYACPDGSNPRTANGQLIQHPVSEYTCMPN
jgi:hypothetical protein